MPNRITTPEFLPPIPLISSVSGDISIATGRTLATLGQQDSARSISNPSSAGFRVKTRSRNNDKSPRCSSRSSGEKESREATGLFRSSRCTRLRGRSTNPSNFWNVVNPACRMRQRCLAVETVKAASARKRNLSSSSRWLLCLPRDSESIARSHAVPSSHYSRDRVFDFCRPCLSR